MKTLYSLIILLLVGLSAFAQPVTPSSNQNYITTITPTVKVTTDAQLNALNPDNLMQEVAYYDGLGRPMQQLAVRASGNKRDLITPVTYDAMGRQDKDYLSYEAAAGNGSYRTDYATTQPAFYSSLHGATDKDYAFSQKQFEPSPLNRVVEQATPGKDWRLSGGHSELISYRSNVANEVRLWKMVSGAPAHQNAYYSAGSLSVVETQDADRKQRILEFKDKQDRLVEVQQVDISNATNKLITSYVYDDLSRLRVVIPPKAQNQTLDAAALNQLAYRYTYDNRGHVIEKYLPGAEVIYYVYDKADRLVLQQDGNMRNRTDGRKWMVTLYDRFNRPVVQGLVSCTSAHSALQAAYKAVTVNQTRSGAGYTLSSVTGVPVLDANGVLSYTFYDSYEGLPTYDATQFTGMGTAPNKLNQAANQTTGSKVKVLDGNEHTASAKWLTTSTYYDYMYRPIQNQSDLYDGASNGKSISSYVLAFDGLPEQAKEVQTFNGQATTILQRYQYDHARRPVKLYHKLNSQAEVLLAETTYDALGRAKTKKLGGIENIQYSYNIRSWATQISSPKFTTDIYYNSGTGITPRWNGNIAATKNDGQAYRYSYDAFNRLAQGIHSAGFSEKEISYDANGNISTLSRSNTVLYNDPEFKQGLNSISVYNNTGNGNVTHSRIAKLADTPTDSPYCLEISNKGTASPGLGGFYWATPSQASKVMVTRILAKIPVGYSINFASNTVGNSPSYQWLSSQAGTGKWEEYVFKLTCGSTGTFSSTNFFYLNGTAGTASAPVKWYVARANVEVDNEWYSYAYEGNRLKTLTKNGAAKAYAYDANGNTVTDGLREVSITYNVLNLPQKVAKGTQYLDYIYDALGNKLAKKLNGTATQYYAGSMVYTGAKAPDYAIHAEGLAKKDGTSFAYQYNLTDHLGNVRTAINSSGGVEQKIDYYPYGLAHSYSNTTKNKYLYNGKELQDELGLMQYDYGARFYNPEIGIWGSVDPMVKFNESPYEYCGDNPINAIDPDGRDYYWMTSEGATILALRTMDKHDVLFSTKDGEVQQTTVNDQSILPGLSTSRSDYDGNYAITNNKNEAFKVFYHAANNTDVEWGIDGYRTSSGNEYVLRTSHKKDEVAASTGLSQYSELNMIFNIHSHPGDGIINWEGTRGGSDGDMDNIRNRYDRFQDAGMSHTGTWFQRNDNNQWSIYPKHYVYHKQSKNLYHYTPWKSSILIRSNTKKGSDLYRNLGF